MDNNNYQNNNYDYQNGQNFYNPQNDIQNFNQPNGYYEQPPAEPSGKAKAFGIVSLVCGILSIVGCFFTMELGIPGIIFGVLAKRASKEQGTVNKKANVGFILSIIGLVVGVIALIAYIVFLAVAVAKNPGTFHSIGSARNYY